MKKKTSLTIIAIVAMFFLMGCSLSTIDSTTTLASTQTTVTVDTASSNLLGATEPTAIYTRDAYAKITSSTDGVITGDVTLSGLEGWSTVYEVTHSIKTPQDSEIDSPDHLPIYITMKISQATPYLLKHMLTGVPIDVELEFYNQDVSGQEGNYYTITLESAIIVESTFTKNDTYGTDSNAHEEYITFGLTYDKITWTFEDGSYEYTSNVTQPSS